ncbi:MAG: hypothetical protein WA871_10490 [Candidatus Acidiferrales bacterium]
MSIKRKWLRAMFLAMIAISSFGGAWMNPKEIEDLLHVMNATKIELALPEERETGDGKLRWIEIGADRPERNS